MTAFERFVCNRYRAGQITEPYVAQLLGLGKISQAAYDHIITTELPCDWTMPQAMVAEV